MAEQVESDCRRGVTADNENGPEARHQSTALVAIALLFVGCFTATWYCPRRVAWPFRSVARESKRVRTGIDPNTARWFELAHLPGIGETLAKRIVALRDDRQTMRGNDRPVFQRPTDLTQARGIGNKKVRRLRRFLRFADVDGGD